MRGIIITHMYLYATKTLLLECTICELTVKLKYFAVIDAIWKQFWRCNVVNTHELRY